MEGGVGGDNNDGPAERMFRRDPVVVLYAPLRVLLRSDADDHAVLVIY